jgi:hypothetical protein
MYLNASALVAYYIVTCWSDYRRGFGWTNRFIDYLQIVTTRNYNIVRIIVIITHK